MRRIDHERGFAKLHLELVLKKDGLHWLVYVYHIIDSRILILFASSYFKK